MHAQPAVDRSPFRKRGLSPAPLRQAVKLLASQEIKQRPWRRANRGWEGPPAQAMAKEERVNPCSWPIWEQRSMPWVPSVVCRRWLHGAESTGSPANTATVPQHPPRATQHAWGRQRGDAPRHCRRRHQHPGCPAGLPLDPGESPTPKNTRDAKIPALHPPALCSDSWSWGPGVNPGTRLWGVSRAPSPTGTVEPLQHRPWCHSPESFCFSVRQNPSPKSSAGNPKGRCHRDPRSRTPRAAVALWGYVPESRKRICLGFTLCPSVCTGLACLERGSGAPRPARTPPSPLPLLKRKEELKMKLKHNSIRSGSRVKSSALIVCWQALPALQQTQCYQGTEGRFVCTGRASCCVRPACLWAWGPPGCTAEDRGCRGLREAGSTPAALAGSSAPGWVLWLGATSRLPTQLSGEGNWVRSPPMNVSVE